MYAIFTMRKLMLTNRINSIQLKMMEISQKTMDLASYSANIADGNVSIEELANSSASIYQRQMLFNQVNGANANVQADAAMQNLIASGGIANAQASGAEVNLNSLFTSFYQNAMKSAAENEQKKISVMEKELDQQRLKLETQLQAAQKELEQVEQAETKGIEMSTPKYSGS